MSDAVILSILGIIATLATTITGFAIKTLDQELKDSKKREDKIITQAEIRENKLFNQLDAFRAEFSASLREVSENLKQVECKLSTHMDGK